MKPYFFSRFTVLSHPQPYLVKKIILPYTQQEISTIAIHKDEIFVSTGYNILVYDATGSKRREVKIPDCRVILGMVIRKECIYTLLEISSPFRDDFNVFTLQGEQIRSWKTISSCFRFDVENVIIMSNQEYFFISSLTGKLLHSWASLFPNESTNFFFKLNQDQIYFLSWELGGIFVCSLKGEILFQILSSHLKYTCPFQISVTNRNIYFLDSSKNCLKILRKDGTLDRLVNSEGSNKLFKFIIELPFIYILEHGSIINQFRI